MEIHTARLLLREFKHADWKAVHEYASDPVVARFMEWGPNSPQETKEFVERTLQQQRHDPRASFVLAVQLKEEPVIGSVGIDLFPQGEQAVVGYTFNRAYWGRGYATEALLALLQYGFEHYKLHRIFATCDAENLASANVLRRCGMRQEAHFIQDKKIKGRWRDTLLFALLRNQWASGSG